MLRFITRRIGFTLFVLITIVYFAYLGMGLVPNSEVETPSFNIILPAKTAWAQTRAFYAGILADDWGTIDVAGNPLPIKEVVITAYINSMGLLLLSIGIATIIGIGLGVRAATRRYTHSPTLMLTATLLGISVPSFFVALLLQQGAIRYQQQFGKRLVSVAGFGWDWQHMLLPILVLLARPIAYLTRTTFIALSNVLDQDYIRTAKAKGLRRRRVIIRHAFRNLAIPLLTAIGVSLRFSLGTLPIVEYFFGWHGLGLRALEGINNRQPDLVAGIAFAFGLTILLINLLLDFSFQYIDPRLREKTETI